MKIKARSGNQTGGQKAKSFTAKQRQQVNEGEIERDSSGRHKRQMGKRGINI